MHFAGQMSWLARREPLFLSSPSLQLLYTLTGKGAASTSCLSHVAALHCSQSSAWTAPQAACICVFCAHVQPFPQVYTALQCNTAHPIIRFSWPADHAASIHRTHRSDEPEISRTTIDEAGILRLPQATHAGTAERDSLAENTTLVNLSGTAHELQTAEVSELMEDMSALETGISDSDWLAP